MRRMIPQKLIDVIKALSQLVGKIVYSSGKVKVNGDFEADGKISVGTPNYSGSFVPKQDLPEGLEWGENAYLSFKIYANILYVVIEAEIKNTTENAITTGALSFLVESLPDSLCEKIIRRDGSNIKSNYSANPTIARLTAQRGTTSINMILNSYNAKSLGGYFDSFSLPANSGQWLSARLFLTL